MKDVQTFDEDRIRFTFDPNAWRVIKWDDDASFTDGIRKLNGELTDTARGHKVPQGTKGVDFVGLHHGSLYLFEVKDFRDHADANAERQEKELSLEIGLKVRDTIAGLVGAHHVRPTDWTAQAVAALAARARPVTVIAWIVEDHVKHAMTRKGQAVLTNVRMKQLQRSLSWLTQRAWDDDPLNPSITLPGVLASNIRAP